MIEINILKNQQLVMKNHEDSSSFFLDFFEKIDDNSLAEIYLSVGNNKLKFDFSYDLLSIYDFLYLLVDYLSTNSKENFTLLLYERGSDKLVFNKNKLDTIEISHYYKKEVYKETVYKKELENSIFNIINNLSELLSMFSPRKKNIKHFQDWESRLISR